MFVKHSIFTSHTNHYESIKINKDLELKFDFSCIDFQHLPLKPLTQLSSSTSAGIYSIMENYLIEKTRGEIKLSIKNFHFEMVKVVIGNEKIPLMIRLWGQHLTPRMEFLIVGGVLRLRKIFFNLDGELLPLPKVLSSFINDNKSQLQPFNDYIWSKLIPTDSSLLMHDNLSDWLHNIEILGHDDNYLNSIIATFYSGLDLNDLRCLISAIEGNFLRFNSPFQSEGSHSLLEHTYIEIDHIYQFYGLNSFALIPFDHWKIIFYPETSNIEILEIDSSAGYNLPFGEDIRLFEEIKEICLNAINDLPFYQSIGTLLIEHNGQLYPVLHIILQRTMDEILEISIYLKDINVEDNEKAMFVINFSCSFIMLSLLSPIITSYQRAESQIRWA